MSASDWWSAVTDSWANLWDRIAGFAPKILGALIVLVIGWIAGIVVGLITDKILRALTLPKLFERIRAEEVVKRTGVNTDLTGLISGLVRWVIYIVAFIAAAEILDLPTVAGFFNQILGYLPNVVAAAAIVLIGVVAANFFATLISGSVRAGDIKNANTVELVVRWAILIFAFLAALAQLGVAQSLIQTLFIGFVALIAIAGGLAFGLGGQGVAKIVVEDWKKRLEK